MKKITQRIAKFFYPKKKKIDGDTSKLLKDTLSKAIYSSSEDGRVKISPDKTHVSFNPVLKKPRERTRKFYEDGELIE